MQRSTVTENRLNEARRLLRGGGGHSNDSDGGGRGGNSTRTRRQQTLEEFHRSSWYDKLYFCYNMYITDGTPLVHEEYRGNLTGQFLANTSF